MDTKVKKLAKTYNMQTHKAKELFTRIEDHLPRNYTKEILERYQNNHGKEIKEQYVKDVKRLKRKDPIVLNLILEFAAESEEAMNSILEKCEN